MSRRRLVGVAAVLAIAVGSVVPSSVLPMAAAAGVAGADGSTGAGAVADSAGAAGVDPSGLVDAIVVLADRPRVVADGAGRRAERLARVERQLRDHATRTQRGLLSLLAARRGQHLVARVTPLWVANEIGVRATPAVLRELARRPDVRSVRLDATVSAPAPVQTAQPAATVVEPNVALVNAPAMWAKGYRGQGIVVASLDTGVDVTHPELAATWRGGTNSWYDPNGQHPTTPTDVNGHGTWTTGVMVGGSAGGSSIGMAPDARWIAAKIFNDRGSATTSGIHQAFQWLLDPDHDPATPDAPDVVNDSWTMSVAGCSQEFQPDLHALRAVGILPVFAAGNDGPTPGTVASPANLPDAFAVGATDDSDGLYPYSSRGPSPCTGAVAPTLGAPGVDVRSTDLYGLYTSASGTSMAAPHVAGAVALLLSAFPDLPADRQAAALENGALDLAPPGPDADVGYGRLDVAASYAWLTATPDFSVAVSPASQTAPPGGAASYTVAVNAVGGFASSVTLSLSGLSTAQAQWSLTPAVLPSGAGTSQLVITTSSTLSAGNYPLTITATSGSTTHTATATLVVTAPPDFTLTVTPVSRSVVAGTGTTFTATVTGSGGFVAPVALTLAGLPASVGTATLTPATVPGTGTAQVAITTSATAPGGSYPLTITGSGGGVSHAATMSLAVTAADFTLSATPSSVSVRRGLTASYTVSTAPLGPFTAPVTLTIGGRPAATTVTLSANPVTVPGSSVLRLRTSTSTPRGTYTVTVTGAAGAVSHRITVQLVVR